MKITTKEIIEKQGLEDINRVKEHPLIHGVLMKPLQPDKILDSIKNPFAQ